MRKTRAEKPEVATFTLPILHKVVLENALTRMLFSNRHNVDTSALEKHSFEYHQDSHATGAVIASCFPPELRKAVRDVYSGNGSPVLVIKNALPDGDSTKASMIIEGIAYSLSKDFASDGSLVPSDAPILRLPKQVDVNVNTGQHTQNMHQDHGGHPAIVALACLKGGQEYITTDFSTSFLHSGRKADETNETHPAEIAPIALLDGDIVIFRNKELLHARHNRRGVDEKLREILTADHFYDSLDPCEQKPDDWTRRLTQRVQEILTPRK